MATTITVKPKARQYQSNTTPEGGYQCPLGTFWAVYDEHTLQRGHTLREAYVKWHLKRYGANPLR